MELGIHKIQVAQCALHFTSPAVLFMTQSVSVTDRTSRGGVGGREGRGGYLKCALSLWLVVCMSVTTVAHKCNILGPSQSPGKPKPSDN